jgi:hypothetical protein
MSYGSGCVRIDRKANGYCVQVTDPAIVAKNNKRDSGKGYTPYQSPEREYIFKSVDEVVKFITKNLDKALPKDEAVDSFESAFDKAAAAVSKEEKD